MKRYGYLIGTICWICAIGLFVAAIASGMTTNPTPIQTYIFVGFGIILFIIGIIIIFPVTSHPEKRASL